MAGGGEDADDAHRLSRRARRSRRRCRAAPRRARPAPARRGHSRRAATRSRDRRPDAEPGQRRLAVVPGGHRVGIGHRQPAARRARAASGKPGRIARRCGLRRGRDQHQPVGEERRRACRARSGPCAATSSIHSSSAEMNRSAGAPAPICRASAEEAANDRRGRGWPRAAQASAAAVSDSCRLAAASTSGGGGLRRQRRGGDAEGAAPPASACPPPHHAAASRYPAGYIESSRPSAPVNGWV